VVLLITRDVIEVAISASIVARVVVVVVVTTGSKVLYICYNRYWDVREIVSDVLVVSRFVLVVI